MDVRETALHRAETQSLINGMFWVIDYNEWSRLSKTDQPIDVAEFFKKYNPTEVREALELVRSVRNDSYHFGEKYWNGIHHKTIIDEIKYNNPGFADDVYERVLSIGIVGTR